MRLSGWHLRLGLSLVLASTLAYALQVVAFRRADETLFYLLQDFAFLPIQVLLVTLILNELLGRRERSLLHQKLNMVIGAFFSEIGNDLLRRFVALDADADGIRQANRLHADSSRADFAAARRFALSRDYKLDCAACHLNDLKSFLAEKRPFMLGLLENPNLLEHESFTDLLWAISHLTEELLHRPDLGESHAEDLAHLSGDAVRAYRSLVLEWLSYARHLQARYPYMYSLVVRTSPFEPKQSAEVTYTK